MHAVPAEPDGTEELMVAKVPLAEAVERVASGEIKDAMSVIALMRAWALVQGNLL